LGGDSDGISRSRVRGQVREAVGADLHDLKVESAHRARATLWLPMSTAVPPPRHRGCCGCGGCLTSLAVLLLAIVAGAVFLFHEATTPYVRLAAISASDAASASGKQKLTAVSLATQQAQTSGRPVPVSVTLTDAEMTSLVADALRQAAQTGSVPPIDGVGIHAAGGGRLEVVASVQEPFVTLPLYLSAHIATPGRQRLELEVTELRIGRIPLPAGVVQSIIDEVRQRLADRVSLPATGKQPIDHVGVAVDSGSLTVTATAEP
jgi:hypothetical protein